METARGGKSGRRREEREKTSMETGGGGGEAESKGGREGGGDVHLTGGGVPPLDSSCLTAHPLSLSLSRVTLAPPFLPSTPRTRRLAFVCQPQQHASLGTHDLTESRETKAAGWRCFD